MKPVFALVLSVLFIGITSLSAETICLRWGDTYSLADGKILTFKHCGHDLELSSSYGIIKVLATIQGEVILFSAQPEELMPTMMLGGSSAVNSSGTPASNMILCGPAEISVIVQDATVINPKFFQLIARVDDPAQTAFIAATTIPTSAVVIPSDAAGPVEIKLESSEDLVNWNSALPGTYGASDSNRFFRVRAQQTP